MDRSLASKIRAANATLVTRRNLDAVGEFFTADYVAHATGRVLAGHAAIRRFLTALWRASADLQVDVEILVAGKDRIAWQRTLRGIQRGACQGFPASGRRIVWRDVVTSRFRDGRIAEDWVITDLAERLLRARRR